MNNNKLAILGIIAVIMAGWAVLQSRMSQPASTTNFASSPLIEGLPIDAIGSITVSSENGTKNVTLERVEGTFAVKEKNNYPADVSKINGLISKCLDIRTRDKITSDAANHADLKVTPETARYVVTFNNKEAQPLTGAAISPADTDSGRAFVRLLSSNDVYAIDSDPWLNTGAVDYVNTKLFEVPRDKIGHVAVRTPQEKYSLAAGETVDTVKLEPIAEGRKQNDSVCKSVFGTLSYLNFEDVMKEAPQEAAFDFEYSCKLNDTTVYKLSIAKNEDKYYAKVSADFLDKTPVEKERRVESEEELKQKEAKLLAIDAVNTFNKQHEGWVYQIPSYKGGDLTKALADLTESATSETVQIESAPATETTEAEPAVQQPTEPAQPAAVTEATEASADTAASETTAAPVQVEAPAQGS